MLTVYVNAIQDLLKLIWTLNVCLKLFVEETKFKLIIYANAEMGLWDLEETVFKFQIAVKIKFLIKKISHVNVKQDLLEPDRIAWVVANKGYNGKLIDVYVHLELF